MAESQENEMQSSADEPNHDSPPAPTSEDNPEAAEAAPAEPDESAAAAIEPQTEEPGSGDSSQATEEKTDTKEDGEESRAVDQNREQGEDKKVEDVNNAGDEGEVASEDVAANKDTEEAKEDNSNEEGETGPESEGGDAREESGGDINNSSSEGQAGSEAEVKNSEQDVEQSENQAEEDGTSENEDNLENKDDNKVDDEVEAEGDENDTGEQDEVHKSVENTTAASEGDQPDDQAQDSDVVLTPKDPAQEESEYDEILRQKTVEDTMRTIRYEKWVNDLLSKIAAGIYSSRGFSGSSTGDLSNSTSSGRPITAEDSSNGGRGTAVVDGQETRYVQSVLQWAETKEEIDHGTEQFSLMKDDLETRLEAAEERAHSLRDEFFEFRRKIGVSSRLTLMGRMISEAQLDEFLVEERRLSDAISTVRLRNIMLRNKCKLLSARAAAKEELAHGLHLIDFEQLKIENASLAEKIGERATELSRLRKKHTLTVMILTHMKEKLQFCEKENIAVAGKLAELDQRLQEERDLLQTEKKERDKLRVIAGKRKSVAGRVADPRLIKDYNTRREALAAAKEQIVECSELLEGLEAAPEY